MIDSMPCHAQSWVEFARRHGIEHRRRRTCCAAPPAAPAPSACAMLFGRAIERRRSAGRWSREKEAIYRELFAPVFPEVAGLQRLRAPARGARPEDRRRHRRRQAQHRLRVVAPADGPAAARHRRRRRRPARQARAGDLPRSRAPHRRRASALHRVRGCALRHRGRAPRRHARRGGVHQPQRRRTGRPARDRRRCATTTNSCNRIFWRASHVNA